MTQVEFTSTLDVQLIESLVSDRAVVDAARVSTLGEQVVDVPPKRTEGLINFLMRNGHTSPFEHGMFKFFIHVPIFVAREFMRHRTFSFNEESGRYRQLHPLFYEPKPHRPLIQEGKVGDYEYSVGTLDQHAVVVRSVRKSNQLAYTEYEHMMNNGVSKEVARMVLPVNIYTSFYATVDPHNLMKFLDLRTDDQAMYEIRKVANQMESWFAEKMPITWEAWSARRQST